MDLEGENVMTDKQIIIGGVDVSGCKYFFDDTSYKRSKTSCSITLKDCKYLDDNCYFKQLARKTQECEELKKDLHQNFKEKDKLHLIIDRLLEASGYDTNTASAEDFEDVYENMRYEKQQLEQLGQTLAEIKEFIQSDYCTEIASCEFCAEAGNCLNRKILQKISEVENN